MKTIVASSLYRMSFKGVKGLGAISIYLEEKKALVWSFEGLPW